MYSHFVVGLQQVTDVHLAYSVQDESISYSFAKINNRSHTKNISLLPYWDEKSNLVQLVTSFDSTGQEVDHFIALATK